MFVKEKKLNKVEGQLTRTKVKFAKLLSEADAVSIKLLAEKSAENKVGLGSCRMCRTLASVLAFLYRTSLIPKALVQETEAHRHRHLLAEGNCVC